MANELTLGQPRYGNLYDDDSATPDINATLERTADGVYLSVVFDHDQSPEFARWFTHDVFAEMFADDGPQSSQPAPTPAVPSELLFVDSHGSVALIGCQNAGYHTNLRIGSGRISVGAAILGAPTTSHARVMGMRSDVSGLRSWLGTSAIHESFTVERPLKTSAARTIKLSPPDAITIPDSGLVMRPAYRLRRPNGALIIEDLVWVEHISDEESSWSSHLLATRAVRDLLAVSRWRAESLVPVSVSRTEDSLEGHDSESARRQWWREVIDSSAPEPKGETQKLEHFITWDDVGPAGVKRWINLREDFSRAIDPAVSSLYLNKATIEVLLMQVAISLEALGFLLAKRQGKSDSQANRLNYKERLDLIIRDVDGLLPFVNGGWSQGMADAYNALKHANRDLPLIVNVANSWRESVLLFRTWVASELGVDDANLRARILRSPQINPFIEVNAP